MGGNGAGGAPLPGPAGPPGHAPGMGKENGAGVHGTLAGEAAGLPAFFHPVPFVYLLSRGRCSHAGLQPPARVHAGRGPSDNAASHGRGCVSCCR